MGDQFSWQQVSSKKIVQLIKLHLKCNFFEAFFFIVKVILR